MPVRCRSPSHATHPSTHAPTASTPEPQPTSSTVDPARSARANRTHRQHRGRVVAEPERRTRFDPQHGHSRLESVIERHPRRTDHQIRRRPTPAGRGRAMCRRPIRRLRRTATTIAPSRCRRSADHRLGVVAERRPQLDAIGGGALFDRDDAERPQRIGCQLDIGGGRPRRRARALVDASQLRRGTVRRVRRSWRRRARCLRGVPGPL